MSLSKEIVEVFKKRYKNVPTLIFQRSIDRANSDVELFDILEGVPSIYPIVWCDEERCWKTATDLLPVLNFDLERIKK
jgi:hypothetical protein